MNKKLYTHLTQKGILQGTTTPIGNVTPTFIGQHYIENQEKIYVAIGLTQESWNLVHSGSQLLLSVSTYQELLEIPLATLQNGAKCYVDENHSYYKLIDNVWLPETNYAYQTEEPVDKSVIWFTPVGQIIEKDNDSPVTIEELMASISVLVTKIKGLEKRIEYLEKFGVSNPSKPNVPEGILLEDGSSLTLEDGNNLKLESN